MIDLTPILYLVVGLFVAWLIYYMTRSIPEAAKAGVVGAVAVAGIAIAVFVIHYAQASGIVR